MGDDVNMDFKTTMCLGKHFPVKRHSFPNLRAGQRNTITKMINISSCVRSIPPCYLMYCFFSTQIIRRERRPVWFTEALPCAGRWDRCIEPFLSCVSSLILSHTPLWKFSPGDFRGTRQEKRGHSWEF